MYRGICCSLDMAYEKTGIFSSFFSLVQLTTVNVNKLKVRKSFTNWLSEATAMHLAKLHIWLGKNISSLFWMKGQEQITGQTWPEQQIKCKLWWESGVFVIKIMLGKKLVEYCITCIYKTLFHCSSRFIMNSSKNNINVLPEHEKSLHFFGVCPTASSIYKRTQTWRLSLISLVSQAFFS